MFKVTLEHKGIVTNVEITEKPDCVFHQIACVGTIAKNDGSPDISFDVQSKNTAYAKSELIDTIRLKDIFNEYIDSFVADRKPAFKIKGESADIRIVPEPKLADIRLAKEVTFFKEVKSTGV